MRLTDEQARSLSMLNAGTSEPLLRTTIYRASRAATLTDQELDFLVNYGRAVQHERDQAAGRAGVTPQRWGIGSPSREQVTTAIGAVLFNVRNFPDAVQSRLLGQDMGALRAKLTDAVAAVLSQPTPSAESEPDRTFEDGYDGGHADGWAAALDVARGVAEDEGDMNYEETNRAAGAVAVVVALERGGEAAPNATTPRTEGAT